MITLGQASNYTAGQVWQHLFACGTQIDFLQLKNQLAVRYHVNSTQVALYHTGRSALAAALRAVAPKGANVIIPGLTCIAVVRAVRAANCNPVFVDIEPQKLEYNYDKLAQKLAELQNQFAQSSAEFQNQLPQNPPEAQNPPETIDRSDNLCYNKNIILVQNTLGITWNSQKLEEIAANFQCSLVEDLAHCAGRFYADGREVGTIGEAAALSFGKGKAIDTISGGAVIIRNSDLIEQPNEKPRFPDRLRDRWYPFLGMVARTFWNVGGLGRKFIGGLVKIGWVQRSADAELDLSHRLTYWQAKLASRQLGNLPNAPLRQYCLVSDRQAVLEKLQQADYYFDEIWYDVPVSPARYREEANFPDAECPETVQIAQSIINLPTWYSEDKLAKARQIIEEYQTE